MSSRKQKDTKKKNTTPTILNKQARRYYEFVETFEAGLVLRGSEVKSLRQGKASLKEGYVRFDKGEAWLVGVTIPVYDHASYASHEPDRPRKLLLHNREIIRLQAKVEQKGLSVVPVKLYFTRGKVKLQIALARGKKAWDHSQEIKQKDLAKDMARQMMRF